MIVSRVGSLLLEPMLKWLKIVSYAPYADYLKASDKDAKMAVMIEANNTYRTLAATFLTITLGLMITWSADRLDISSETREFLLALMLFGIFLASFRKQSAFIVSRVKHYLD